MENASDGNGGSRQAEGGAEEALGVAPVRNHLKGDTDRACRLAEDGNLRLVTSEKVDVGLDPSKGSTLCGYTGISTTLM